MQKKLLERVQIPETYLSKEVKELSGGEKQRVAIGPKFDVSTESVAPG